MRHVNLRQTAWACLIALFFSPPATAMAITSAQLIAAALERTKYRVRYDGSYHALKYPGGDVPANIGVCTDVLIRSYRKAGVDLQELVHNDMKKNFPSYPSQKIWGLKRPDTNIDHRRVPNLQVFFTRNGQALPVTDKAQDFTPGDLATWMLPGNLPHIGIVTDQYNNHTGNPMVVHNIGQGPQLEDMLFSYPITGHYRYLP
jgi:uncharacterized protein YijF (DUF1287 family)